MGEREVANKINENILNASDLSQDKSEQPWAFSILEL